MNQAHNSDRTQPASLPIGVSVVICCHNSARRLPPTLEHLAAQQIRNACWEVILVDNSSTDDTAEVARRCWPEELSRVFRIVAEPQLGLTYARARGLREAAYEFVCFVDDDNWLCETWVEDVLDLMSRHPQVAVSGGINQEVTDVPVPGWFHSCKAMWAVSVDEPLTGDITDSDLTICGAGLTLRQSAWRELAANGFTPLLTGRRGASLVSNEDNELCTALRLAGWRLWVEPRLRLKHFLPANRLTWEYARRLHHAAGLSGVALDAYFYGGLPSPKGIRARLREHWQWQVFTVMKRFLLLHFRFLQYWLFKSEGRTGALWVEQELGRLAGLFRSGGDYSRAILSVRNARWLQSGRSIARHQADDANQRLIQPEPVAASDRENR